MSTYDTNSIYEWFGGNSKATALMSAEIANYFNKEIDLDGIGYLNICSSILVICLKII